MEQMIGREDILRLLIKIREVEQLLLKLFEEGKIRGTTHTCIGQEAVAVGVISCVNKEIDTVFSNHRGHGHYIAFKKDVRSFLAEVMGKKGALCNGIGGSQHLHDKNYYSNGVQGGVPGIATGLALAHKLDKKGAVSFAFLGDGTFGEGLTYEALNIASLWELPILYIVEDNEISQSTTCQLNRAGQLLQRFTCFDIKAIETDGQDVDNVIEATNIALVHIRSGNGPFGIVFKTHRFSAHSKGDDTRPIDTLEKIKQKEDPIDIFISKYPHFSKCRSEYEKSVKTKLSNVIRELEETDAVSWVKDKKSEEANFLPLQDKFIGTVANRLNSTLHNILKDNDRAIVIGEDVLDPYGGAFKITKGISTAFPEQIFTTPISEAGIMAVGNGLALRGYHPIVEIMFGDFLFLCADQIVNHAIKMQTMYGRDINFSCVIRTPMGGRRGYGPTHSQTIEKHFFGMPGLTVVAINPLVDPGFLLELSINKKTPVLFIENKSLYTHKYIDDDTVFKKNIEQETIGTRIVTLTPIQKQADCVIVLYGGMVPIGLKAAKQLIQEEVYPIIIVPELLNPIGDKFMSLLIKICLPTIFVEESNKEFGWASEILSNLLEKQIRFPVSRIGSKGACIPATVQLEYECLPQVIDIISAITNLLDQESA